MAKSKRIMSVFLAVIMVLGVITVAPFSAAGATYGDYEYTLEDNFTCTITGYNGADANITIPSKIYGNKVTTIGSEVFRDNNNLVSVTIPNTVTKLSHSVFSGCKNLSKVNLSSHIKEIGSYAFLGSGLKSVTLPSGIKDISWELFSNCENLESVTIPNTVTHIDEYAFYKCINLSSITIPNSVEEICKNAFSDCVNLQSITIGSGLKYFDSIWEELPFYGCSSLETITVSSKNPYFKSSKGVLFDKKKTEILWYPQGKSNTSYVVPNSVKAIYYDTFVYNPYLKEVTIYDKVTKIDDNSVGYIKDGWDDYYKISGFTIKGYKGTVAERYARNNDFNFVELPRPVAPTSVKLNKTKLTLVKGESYTLTKTISPANAVQNVTWSSSNKNVATVSKGVVTAHKKGTAYITVKTSNGKTAQCKVTVKIAPTAIKLTPASVTLGEGESYSLKKSISPSKADKSCKWSSSNSSVAKVSKGKVTAKTPGTAYITAKTSNGKTAQCKVTVKAAPTNVKIKPARVKLKKGKKRTISGYINSGSYANGSNIKWSTSNKKIATVKKGKGKKAVITAKSKGTAYIKIKLYNGKTATCKVKVK